jgi:hypothetical protein
MNREWLELLAAFPSATPELIVQRELRRRADSKFLLPPGAAAELLPKLTGRYAVLSAGGEVFASYRTLYFDTPELDFFHAQRRRQRVRHKARVRHYPDRRLSLLEVKMRKGDLETTKIWREREYGRSELSADDQAFVRFHTGVRRGVLPQAWTDFRRLTLLGIETNERITIDLDLGVKMGARARSISELAIVEVKQWPFSRRTPVMSALRAAGWRPGWVSKYCAAVAFTHPDVRANELLPGLRILERGAA